MLVLPRNLCALSKLASSHSGRYSMSAIKIRETSVGYEALATDGRRLGIVTGPGADCPSGLVVALGDGEAPALEALVPAGAWNRIFRAGGKSLDPVVARLGSRSVTFASGNMVESVPQVEGRFPDVECVRVASAFEIAVDAKLLADVLLVALQFAEVGSHKAWLHFRSATKPMAVTSRNEQGQAFTGIVMPLT